MKLNLQRPVAFFDLETTGLNIGVDRIVEIAILKAMPDGTEEVKTMRVNPGMPIPLQSSMIHGIYDEHVSHQPTFDAVAAELAEFIGDADLAGFNSNKFDVPVLLEEFLRVGVDFDMSNRRFVDVQNIFHQMEQRTLKAAYKFYCDEEIVNAHSAEADIRATYCVLLAQLERYAEREFQDKNGNVSVPVKNDIDALHAFTNMNKPVDFAGRMVYNDQNEECFNFGKHKGKTVEEVFTAEPSYYAWMKQGDFPLFTKKKLDEIWTRWNSKKEQVKQERQGKQPDNQSQSFKASYPRREVPHKPQQQPRPEKKDAPLTNDMLDQLKLKFGK